MCPWGINTILCGPQAVCSRRSWWLILPALSGVFRPPHQQVRKKGFHLGRINCCLLLCFLSAVPSSQTHLCCKGYLSTEQRRQQNLIQLPRVYQVQSLVSNSETDLSIFWIAHLSGAGCCQRRFKGLDYLTVRPKFAGGAAALLWLKGGEVWAWQHGMASCTPSEATTLQPRLLHLD